MGGAALEILERRFGEDFGLRVAAFAGTSRSRTLRSGRVVPLRPLESLDRQELAGAHVIHLAYLRRELVDEIGPEGWRRATDAISQRMVWALGGAPASVFFASSGIAARPESDQYAAAKRRDEARLAEACAETGARLLTARVFAVAGPYITRPRAFALGELLIRALRGEELVVRAPHRVIRSYISVMDVMALAVAEAVEPSSTSSRVVDLCGTAPLELGELAARIARVVGGRTTSRTPDSSLPEDSYTGDPTRMMELMGRHGIAPMGLDDQIADTASWLAATTESSR